MKKTKLILSIIMLIALFFTNVKAQVIPLSSIKWGCNLDSNANDVKGLNNGTVTGCTFNGYPNGCTFNGTSDYIAYTAGTPFNLSGFTFAKMIALVFTTTDTCFVEGNSDAIGTPSTQGLYVKVANGYVTVGFWQNKGLIYNELTSTTQLNDSIKHLIIFTRSTYGGNLYIDGNSIPVATYNTAPAIRTMNNSNATYSIGRLGNKTNKYFTGTVMCSYLFNANVVESKFSYLWDSGNIKRFPFN